MEDKNQLPNHGEKIAQGALAALQKEFLVVGKTRVKSWTAWLLIGVAVGITAGIVFVANRNEGVVVALATINDSEQILAKSNPLVTIRRITDDPAEQRFPDISGHRIVWSDKRNGNWDIYLFDLRTNKEQQITFSTASQSFPRISGNYIVYTDEQRGGKIDVFLFDLSTNKERQITTSGQAHTPEIDGHRIVWLERRNGRADIFLFDLRTNEERRITTNAASPVASTVLFDSIQPWLSISGNFIVWADRRSDPNFLDPPVETDIFLYDLRRNLEIQLTSDPRPQYDPAISGSLVVWGNIDQNAGKETLTVFDIRTKKEEELPGTLSPFIKEHPDISRKKIVFTGFGGIFLYDLHKKVEHRISGTTSVVFHPSIVGNQIVWFGDGVNSDVFWARIR